MTSEPLDDARRVNGITYRVGTLERRVDEMCQDVKDHGRSLVAIETNLTHVKNTTDDLVKGLGGRVLIGASGGAGIVTAIAIALLQVLGG